MDKFETVKRVGLGGAIAAAVLAATPQPAEATSHGVSTWIGNHRLSAGANEYEPEPGWEYWWDFETGEVVVPTVPWMTVCDYQGAFYVYNPDGSLFETNVSPRHSGCSIAGWFFYDHMDGNYVEDKRFTAKWTSDQTGDDWKNIGTLTD